VQNNPVSYKGVLNNYFFKGKYAHRHVGCLRHLGCSKKHALSLSKGSPSKAAASFGARSVLPVSEHGKLVTCLREGRERRWRLFSTAP